MALLDALLLVWIWFFCAFGAGFVAESKGYGFTLWCVLGIVAGPFAVLVVGFMAAAEQNVEMRQQRERAEAAAAKKLAGAGPSKGEEPKVYEIP